MPARHDTPRPDEEWLSPARCAEIAGVSDRTIRSRIADGSLPATRFGERLVRIRRADLDAMFRPIPSAAR